MTLITDTVHTTSKQRLLRDLNSRYRDRQTALNQALHSITRALQLEEQEYQRERTAILKDWDACTATRAW